MRKARVSRACCVYLMCESLFNEVRPYTPFKFDCHETHEERGLLQLPKSSLLRPDESPRMQRQVQQRSSGSALSRVPTVSQISRMSIRRNEARLPTLGRVQYKPRSMPKTILTWGISLVIVANNFRARRSEGSLLSAYRNLVWRRRNCECSRMKYSSYSLRPESLMELSRVAVCVTSERPYAVCVSVLLRFCQTTRLNFGLSLRTLS